jgi:rsbT antagonist protein RsbS
MGIDMSSTGWGGAPEHRAAPLMKLGHCLFVLVPGALRDTAARELHDAVAERLAKERGIRGLVIDVSALQIVDSFAARVLEETAHVARSFGARPVLVGLHPEVAITLVDLGIDLATLDTALNLERALTKLKLRIVSEDLDDSGP